MVINLDNYKVTRLKSEMSNDSLFSKMVMSPMDEGINLYRKVEEVYKKGDELLAIRTNDHVYHAVSIDKLDDGYSVKCRGEDCWLRFVFNENDSSIIKTVQHNIMDMAKNTRELDISGYSITDVSSGDMYNIVVSKMTPMETCDAGVVYNTAKSIYESSSTSCVVTGDKKRFVLDMEKDEEDDSYTFGFIAEDKYMSLKVCEGGNKLLLCMYIKP